VQLYTAFSTMYNLYCLLRAETHLDTERLARAVGTAFRAHPSYLTTLDFGKDWEVLQRYSPEIFEEIRVEHISEEELAKVRDTLVQPFVIMGKRLFRCRIFETEASVYLFLDIHHILSDGASFRILMNDISKAYDGREIGADYYYLILERREKEKKSAFYRESKQYFEDRYGGVQWTRSPMTDHNTWENESDEFFADIHLPAERISAAERKHRVSRNELMISAAILAIAAYNRTGDVLISWIYNGRDDSVLMNTTGLLFRELPVAVRLDRTDSLEALFNDIRNQVRGGIEHSCYPYAEACFSGIRTTNTCLLYQQNLYDTIRFGETVMQPVRIRQNRAASQTILDIEVMDSTDGIRILLDYAASLYERSSMEHFGEVLAGILQDLTDEDETAGTKMLRRIRESVAEEKQ